MNPRWNDSSTVKRWIVIGAAFVLALVMIACLAGHPAGAATPTAQVSWGATVGDVIQATAFDTWATQDAGAARLINDTGTKRVGPCWGWQQDFPVKDAFGKTMYNPGVRVVWCANVAQTKVTKLVTWDAYDGGGYYNFTGVDKSKGKLGYPSLGLSATWHYQMYLGLPGLYDYRTPSIVFSVYPNGHVVGTIYYDN